MDILESIRNWKGPQQADAWLNNLITGGQRFPANKGPDLRDAFGVRPQEPMPPMPPSLDEPVEPGFSDFASPMQAPSPVGTDPRVMPPLSPMASASVLPPNAMNDPSVRGLAEGLMRIRAGNAAAISEPSPPPDPRWAGYNRPVEPSELAMDQARMRREREGVKSGRGYDMSSIGPMIGGLAPPDGAETRPLSFAGKERLWASRDAKPVSAAPTEAPRPFANPDTLAAAAEAARQSLLDRNPSLSGGMSAVRPGTGTDPSPGTAGDPAKRASYLAERASAAREESLRRMAAGRDHVMRREMRSAGFRPVTLPPGFNPMMANLPPEVAAQLMMKQMEIAAAQAHAQGLYGHQNALADKELVAKRETAGQTSAIERERMALEKGLAGERNKTQKEIAEIDKKPKPGDLTPEQKLDAGWVTPKVESGEMTPDEAKSKVFGKPAAVSPNQVSGPLSKIPPNVRKELTGKSPEQVIEYLRINHPALSSQERTAAAREFNPKRLGISEMSPSGVSVTNAVAGITPLTMPFYYGGQMLQGKLPRPPISEVNKHLDPWWYLGYEHPASQ